MITRRRFVHASLAASAATLLGCKGQPDAAQTPAAAPNPGGTANAELLLYFVGGTAFVKDADVVTALQLSGKDVTHRGYKLEHASYLGGPPNYVPADAKMPALATNARQHGFEGLNAMCLVGKTITVRSKKEKPADIRCGKLADYGHVAGGKWTRKGEWDPTKNSAINSMFKLYDGDVRDAPSAVNPNGEKVKWWIKDDTRKKDLSDLAFLDLKGPQITISGLPAGDIVLRQGEKLTLWVFSGPLYSHGANHKYKWISHALLLKTIYDVKDTPDEHIMPQTESEIEGVEGTTMANPCHKGTVEPQVMPVPPDSEYCPNYDELP